jgi:hypothetical protein
LANEVGVGATLAVVRTGQRLASLDGVTNAGAFVEKLRRDDRSGGSELKDCLIPSIMSTVARNTDCARRPASDCSG